MVAWRFSGTEAIQIGHRLTQIDTDRSDGNGKIILETFNYAVGSESAQIAAVRTHNPEIWEAATLTIRPVKISVTKRSPVRSSRAMLVGEFKQSATGTGAASGEA